MSFVFSLITVTLLGLSLLQSQRFRRSILLVGLISLIWGQSLPALAFPQLAAMGAVDSALTEKQKVLDESLKIDPTKRRYRGLESVQFQPDAEKLNDAQIKSAIKADINDDIFAAVASGSVQIFGDVQDIDIARDIVTQIKAIPGVREVMFDMGLETKAE